MGLFDAFKKKDANLPQDSLSKPDNHLEDFSEYLNQVGDYYVAGKQLDLTDQDLAEATVSDLSQAWRLYLWYVEKAIGFENLTEEQITASNNRIERLASALCEKILQLDHLYCLYHKETDEPALFQKISVSEEGGLTSTEPLIRIFTDRDLEIASTYPEDQYSIVKIENKDGRGIINFLHHAFYIDGAMGVELGSDAISIAGSKLVQEPDFSDLPEEKRPIHHPDLMRWLLLAAQLGEVAGEEKLQQMYHYQYFIGQEVLGHRYLAPSQVAGLSQDENGNTQVTESSSLAIVTTPGQGERKAIQLFTDWNQFRKRYDNDYDGWMMTVEEAIDHFDVVIDPNPNCPRLGLYLDLETVQALQQQST